MCNCTQPERIDTCITNLESDKCSFDATTVEALTRISLEMVTKRSNATLFALANLTRHYAGKPIEELLRSCAQLYIGAPQYLDIAANSMVTRAYGDASERVREVSCARGGSRRG
ncbi:hypothetical protein QJS10_CPA05g02242 [Acorus calamus]|uniref:Uncharacterized protein n=1 Tax=Acorus calamus TaxID=4465 RepID=A0AAV9ESK0_ACOCL|nr:hypothetical protein QJS10_CPA05g02242 [Acorus calamus]